MSLFKTSEKKKTIEDSCSTYFLFMIFENNDFFIQNFHVWFKEKYESFWRRCCSISLTVLLYLKEKAI